MVVALDQAIGLFGSDRNTARLVEFMVSVLLLCFGSQEIHKRCCDSQGGRVSCVNLGEVAFAVEAEGLSKLAVAFAQRGSSEVKRREVWYICGHPTWCSQWHKCRLRADVASIKWKCSTMSYLETTIFRQLPNRYLRRSTWMAVYPRYWWPGTQKG